MFMYLSVLCTCMYTVILYLYLKLSHAGYRFIRASCVSNVCFFLRGSNVILLFFYAFVKYALSEYMCAAHYKAFSHSEYTCTIYLINVGSKHNAIS